MVFSTTTRAGKERRLVERRVEVSRLEEKAEMPKYDPQCFRVDGVAINRFYAITVVCGFDKQMEEQALLEYL